MLRGLTSWALLGCTHGTRWDSKEEDPEAGRAIVNTDAQISGERSGHDAAFTDELREWSIASLAQRRWYPRCSDSPGDHKGWGSEAVT